MDYVCYIDRSKSDTPFMDIVQANDLNEARKHARILMAQRPDSIGARLYLEDEQVGVVEISR